METFVFIICHAVMACCGLMLMGVGLKFKLEKLKVVRERKIKTVQRKPQARSIIFEEDIDRSLHFPVSARVSA